MVRCLRDFVGLVLWISVVFMALMLLAASSQAGRWLVVGAAVVSLTWLIYKLWQARRSL